MPKAGETIVEPKLSEKQILRMASNGSPMTEIADACGIDNNTLERRYGKKIKEARALGKGLLRDYQMRLAARNAAMAKHLGVNMLGQKLGEYDEKPVNVKEELTKLAQELFQVMGDKKE